MSKVNISNVCDAVRREHAEAGKQWAEEEAKLEAKHKELMAAAKSKLFAHCRPATRKEYSDWLSGFIVNGGVPQYCGDRMDMVLMALGDFECLPLCGSSARYIIVPPGIKALNFEERGHCGLLFVEGFHFVGAGPFLPSWFKG